MDFSKNIKAYLNSLPLSSMSAAKKFLAVAAYCSKGDLMTITSTKTIRSNWHKSILKLSYHPTYYYNAQKEGWLDSAGQGTFKLTSDGLKHLEDIAGLGSDLRTTTTDGNLLIFDEKHTHSFDKFLRGILANAQSLVLLVDPYVDDTIFDNVIDSADRSITIKLIYKLKQGNFDSRVLRFQREYLNFSLKRFNRLHDRFIIIDDQGYVIGPSLKDAADNSPAILVKLDSKDSAELERFFQQLWSVSV